MEKSSKIFGLRTILEAINSQHSIDKVFLQKNTENFLMNQLKKAINKHRIAFSYVPVEKLNKLSKFGNHQGAVAQIAAINFYDLETILKGVLEKNKLPLFLVLDKISDVRNFGAIIRTACCTGVDAIIIGKNAAAPVNEQTIKTSVGGVFHIPICKVTHIKDALFILQSVQVQMIAATEKSSYTLYEMDFTKPTAIIIGSEDKGIHRSVLKMCDAKAKLPITGNIASLNVSVACGAFLYEAIRQRTV